MCMDIVELSQRLENLIRFGTVIAVDHAARRCRVKSGNIETQWIKFNAGRAGNTRTWNPPTIGEQVTILSPSGELANGIAVPSIYSDAHDAPSNSPDLHIVEYPDGAVISYNHQTHALTATGIATANIQASTSITLDTPIVNITGKLDVTDLVTYHNGMNGSGGTGGTTVNITGDIVVDGISFLGHRHPEHDGGNTAAPI